MANWLKIYHKSPPVIRNLAGSMRGLYLKHWRYGPETEELVEQALERDQWEPDQWKDWQERQLEHILQQAAIKVPYYRNQWMERRRNRDRSSWNYLENWPVLKKDQIRQAPLSFVPEDCNPKALFIDRTSGTTGTPLSIYISKASLHRWYAIFEARMRRWHSVSIKDRWAIMGGQLVAPYEQDEPPFGVYNYSLNQLYLSTHHISPRTAAWYAEELCKYQPTHMIAYPSSATVLANAIVENRYPSPQMKVVFSNAESLLEDQRRIISEAFRCPVRDSYGMGEYAVGASECEANSLHTWPDSGFIEVFADLSDEVLEYNKTGRLILTGLLNLDMPLIRYEVGDRGRLAHPEQSCDCGRNMQILTSIEGRLHDLIITPDRRQIFWINPVFYGLPLIESQIIQEDVDKIRVRFVPSQNFSPQDAHTLIERLKARLGHIQISLEPVPEIPREKNGKFRAVICEIPEAEKRRLLQTLA